MSTRFLVIARVVDDGFDDVNDYYLDFEITVKPAATVDQQPIYDWYYTTMVPEDLVEVEGRDERDDLYKYLQEDILLALKEEFGSSRFASYLDKTDILLQGVAGKGDKGDSNGPQWQNQWRRGVPYAVNDVVAWNDRAWICIQAVPASDTYRGSGLSPWDAYDDNWPDGWQSSELFNIPPVLSRIDPQFHAELKRYVTVQGDPATATDEITPYLNPNRFWDPYTNAPLKFLGSWQANKTYYEGNVVYRGRKRRRRNNQDEEAEQTLQFIAMKTSKGDDPLNYDVPDGNPTDDPWEIFLDAREVLPSKEWGMDPDEPGELLETADEFFYLVNDIVTWQGATYICTQKHQFLTSDRYVSEEHPGLEPDDQSNSTVAARWSKLSDSPPKTKGKWSENEKRYYPGDVVWYDQQSSPNGEDEKLQFICIRSHKPKKGNGANANNPTKQKILSGEPADLPWKVFLDLGDVIPDDLEGGLGNDRTVYELVKKRPFVKPKRIPKTLNENLVVNEAKVKVPYDVTETKRLEVEVVFTDSNYASGAVEWWLYAFEQMKADLNSLQPIWTMKLTGTNAPGQYSNGVASASIQPSTEAGTPNYSLGYSNGVLRRETVFALAIKRVVGSGGVKPSAAGKIDAASITVVSIGEED